jgi:large subunit ribosomal protein L9
MATQIEVLLRENVAPLGKCGDVVRVRPGYARNFLFPNRLALEASEDNKRVMLRRRAKLEVEEEVRNAAIDERVAKLTGISVATAMKADEGGHLFGSVNAAAIAELLQRAGHAVEERDVRLDAPIKSVGAHVVRVHVFGERFVDVNLNVTAQG